jgi:hypothetical protein
VRSVAGEEAVAVELEALDHVGHGVAWSVYLPDPDGYQVEITTYEAASA